MALLDWGGKRALPAAFVAPLAPSDPTMNYFQRRARRKHAKELLHHCRAVLNMRRDLLSPELLEPLNQSITELDAARRTGDAARLAQAVEAAETTVMAASPRRSAPHLRELAETLVVAFGVAMAFRAYFFQPFKIPTGSMQPTLYGIHSVGQNDDGSPVRAGLLDHYPFKPLKWLVTGQWYREVLAPDGGTVIVSADRANAPGYVFVTVRGVRSRVPNDAFERGELNIPDLQVVRDAPGADTGGQGINVLARGVAPPGARIWSGYVTAGDHVFVNRMKWNFFPPRRGQIMVFETDGIPDLNPGEHYIKRLVGLPGERIGIDEPYLSVDGARVTEPDTLLRISERRPAWRNGPHYSGYALAGRSHFVSQVRRQLVPAPLGVARQTLPLGEDEFLALGDNTGNSYDGRYWGPVPRRRLVGPASCIYWPISRRWGLVN